MNFSDATQCGTKLVWKCMVCMWRDCMRFMECLVAERIFSSCNAENGEHGTSSHFEGRALSSKHRVRATAHGMHGAQARARVKPSAYSDVGVDCPTELRRAEDGSFGVWVKQSSTGDESFAKLTHASMIFNVSRLYKLYSSHNSAN